MTISQLQNTDRLDADAAHSLAERTDLANMMAQASALRDQHFGRTITYSRKVFIPLTKLCRDVCHYCTFAQPPRNLEEAFLSPEQVLTIAREGAAAGCIDEYCEPSPSPSIAFHPGREPSMALP